ncbi:hypothetical protein [Pseudonocardia sp. 73-21]|uniref:hypothetical protein n=1 Tax=Pseudonocardia sp. 73-21 TaxID=1895809 RepID=UPI0009691C14|nr:hypothetical protein [Pseudonocardia sp. 73-21]OJY38841.1 MAG: hypothetical protein BGP03_28475 [Pseudonocardia sp. 73-21]
MSFFLTVYVVDFVVAIVLFPVWLAAALLVGRISRHPEPGRVRRPAVAAAVVIGLGLLLLVARFVLVGGQAQSGIELVTDRKLVTLLMITIPAVAVVLLALPGLAAVRRAARSGEPSALRVAATSPRLLVPVRLTAFGAVGGMLERFLPPARALWADLLVYGLVMVAAAVVIAGLSLDPPPRFA